MLKNTILNSCLIETLCRLGHTQTLCICDAGLPIPPESKLIDLAFLPGYPDIYTVTKGILACTPIEKVYCAQESISFNTAFTVFLEQHLDCEISFISHDTLKKMSCSCVAYVRTGECTPYANIILQAATSF
ncbi:D-ribose pyranase [Eisenbergiella porci]|uniref:D-ribose pyranase n=1 Tax=Eisenbergiella porci TaxID=2652274 RepID=UPI002A80FF70|nr:D-ribose pyranase [Eisenbergiella porci]